MCCKKRNLPCKKVTQLLKDTIWQKQTPERRNFVQHRLSRAWILAIPQTIQRTFSYFSGISQWTTWSLENDQLKYNKDGPIDELLPIFEQISLALIIAQGILCCLAFKWRWMAEGVIYIELAQLALKFAIP